ncbi:hypothetical protein THAOC_35475 [Thalassiosira oceanica]|uniref:uracil phosphoribosyltransferase n=1 Tax=Thalassiosira oceanica TaxID=159749 RepID=K0R1Q2_THAOC|nr:hypothetical protein THAOC_35475 [Thalassiosira oceanica]|mmetsp:Transcript_37802/g.90432  ORF Transcript_37802/g.90432 Transcript_37802/m.90432 type:complete len:224 (-) Transcript_37802:65-736(-)|eukprot:EJK45890.1 hypothetical protein THAOC_35475 [Thalassiosira oceanica]
MSYRHPNLTVVQSAAFDVLFTKIRDEKTSSADFGRYSRRLMRILAEESLSKLPKTVVDITTPTGAAYKGRLSIVDTDPDSVCAVSIVRAGDSLLESVREIAPSIRVGKMWIQRNEASAEKEAIHSCTKLPPGVKDMDIVLCDPMLASGGSSCSALDCLINTYGVDPRRVVFANVISCPEGLNRLAHEYPDVRIVTCWVDEKLNDSKFILPGLGDYGDRYFNTV